MRKRRRYRASIPAFSLVLAALLGTLLGACSTDKKAPPVEPNIVPTNYKQEIMDTLSRTLVDPTNIRGAYISDPQLQQIDTQTRYVSCVRFDARDADRHYEGSKQRIAYFFAGHLNQLVEATPEQCSKAAYKPFPELEKLCRGSSCK